MHIHKLHTTLCASITVCLSRLFIYLLAYLFICVFIIRWTDFLFYLQALFRRESGRTFILWWEQSLIQNRPIPPSIPLSDCLFLSVHQTGSRSLSQPISPTFCHRLSLCVSLSFPLYIFQTHPFLARASLPLSFFFFSFPEMLSPYFAHSSHTEQTNYEINAFAAPHHCFQVIFRKISHDHTSLATWQNVCQTQSWVYSYFLHYII